MESWKQTILEAFAKGRTIQSNNFSPAWHDFIPQNQIDRPNLDYGTPNNWRIKPDEEERKEILEAAGAYTETPMMKERTYSKEHMLMFGGFCAGKLKLNPQMSGSEIWDEWEKIIS